MYFKVSNVRMIIFGFKYQISLNRITLCVFDVIPDIIMA